MKAQDIFIGTDNRLRSGWRFGVFTFAFTFASFFFGSIALMIVSTISTAGAPQSALYFIVSSAISLTLAIIIGWLCGKYFEQLPFRALGAWFTGGWFIHFILGIFIGALTLGVALGIASGFGNLDFSLNNANATAIANTLITSFILFAVAALFEESLFRGYILQTFARSGLAWFAILLTAVFFGVVHLGNPNAGYLSSLNTALAGIWFGVAYLKTRDVWFVWGMHLMWNWVQGAIFGVEVSGLTDIVHSPLLKEIDGGPAWLTGENYGIEASIACTIALVISTVGIHFLPFLKPDPEMHALTSKSVPRAIATGDSFAEARTK
ncbi:MAG: lysostaphin resistance A-like protein [Pyrinomonadaceae bacterium]